MLRESILRSLFEKARRVYSEYVFGLIIFCHFEWWKSINSCVLFCLLKDKRGVSRFWAIKWSARLKWPLIVLLKGGSFELIKKIRKFFSPEVWPEVSRKYKNLFSWSNKYELRQHANAINFWPVLTVHSRMWVCLLKGRNGRIYYTKKRAQLLT